MTTLRRLLALAEIPRGRAALATLLAALAVAFAVGLMTTAGYLISRAAEHPPILALTTTIVAVRFFGLARPLARYLERLASHDLALRALANVRSRFYERIEPLAPAELEGYRRGDLLTRMVRDVDELQSLFVRGSRAARGRAHGRRALHRGDRGRAAVRSGGPRRRTPRRCRRRAARCVVGDRAAARRARSARA